MRIYSTTSSTNSKPSRPHLIEKTAVTENDVEAAIVGFLRRRGWTVERNQVGLLYTADGRPCPVGRKGQCDWRALRPVPDLPGAVEYFEVEVKRPGAKPTNVQREYMALRTHLGYLVTWADSPKSFHQWYEEAFGADGGAK